MPSERDLRVRLAAFEWLREQIRSLGEVLPRDLLAEGFVLDGTRVPLLGPQGIFKPRLCELPLSITTLLEGGPYADAMEDGTLRYSYRGTDSEHPDNVGLRRALAEGTQLVLFARLMPGRYMPVLPVYVVGDDPRHLTFFVQADELSKITGPDVGPAVGEERDSLRRAYITATVRQRLHQRRFRERVLAAYREQCALCRLRHQELLDAAHIIGDAEDEGDPVVSNGLALCKLHHAAFDRFFLTVRPDYVVEVRPSILAESDGPMLLVGLKQVHGRRIEVPRAAGDRPDPVRLQRRLEQFRAWDGGGLPPLAG